jgi:small subunit ribosomal protein S1
VHISELAPHHVENPREVVSQGDAVNVRILEIDGERRRLSLSLKRVEEGDQPVPRADGAESVHTMPDLRLSEEAFPTSSAAVELDAEEEAADAVAEVVEAEADEAGENAGEIVADVELEEAEEIVAEVELEEAVEAEEIVAEVELEEAEEAEEIVAEAEAESEEPEPEAVEEAAEEPVEVGSEQSDSD